MGHQPKKLVWMDGETGVGDGKKINVTKSYKDKKLWRAMSILLPEKKQHIKEVSTSFLSSIIYK